MLKKKKSAVNIVKKKSAVNNVFTANIVISAVKTLKLSNLLSKRKMKKALHQLKQEGSTVQVDF